MAAGLERICLVAVGALGELPKVSFIPACVWEWDGRQARTAAPDSCWWERGLRCRDKGRGIGSFSSCFWENSPPFSRLCSNQGAAFCLQSRGSSEGLFLLPTKHRSTQKHGSAPCQELHFLQDFSFSISWESLSKSLVLILPPLAVGVWGER